MAATIGAEVGRPGGWEWLPRELHKSSVSRLNLRTVIFSRGRPQNRKKLGLLVCASGGRTVEGDDGRHSNWIALRL